MRHRKLALAASTALIGATPATADTPLHREYQRAYRDVQRRLGHRAPGRNIVRWGLRSGRQAPAAIVARSLRVLHRMLAPRLVVPAGSTVSATPAPAPAPPSAPTSPSAAGASGLPACASESGTNYSTGPGNTNPSSGATGRYQEMPMHRAPGGLCYGMSLSPAGQDACALTIYRHQGAGAWTNCTGG